MLDGSKLQIAINGTRIRAPQSYKVSSYRLTKSGRVANGDMTAEIIAKKRKLFLSYPSLSSTDVKQLEDLVGGDTAFFFTVTYTEDGEEKSMIAYAGEFQKTLVREGPVWYWKDVQVNFIEK